MKTFITFLLSIFALLLLVQPQSNKGEAIAQTPTRTPTPETAIPLIYRAVIAQEGESAPYEAFLYENTLDATLTFARIDAGLYSITTEANIFTYGKTLFTDALYNEGFGGTNLRMIKYRQGGQNGENIIYISVFDLTAFPIDEFSVYLKIEINP